MPYIRRGQCVYKKTGKKMGCSKNVEKAKAHMRALYANVKDVKKVNSVNTWNGIFSPDRIGEKNGR